jgi:hypothetical protein
MEIGPQGGQNLVGADHGVFDVPVDRVAIRPRIESGHRSGGGQGRNAQCASGTAGRTAQRGVFVGHPSNPMTGDVGDRLAPHVRSSTASAHGEVR